LRPLHGLHTSDTLLVTPASPSLLDVPVVVWSCPLDLSEPAWVELVAGVAPAERRDAERRADPLDRRRLLAARGWRRRLLAAELGCDPGEVPIVVDGRGKPRIAGGRDAELRFSASRSRELTLVALSRRMEVGVDVEAVDPATDVERFAARFLSESEQRAVTERSPDQRREALFACWTRKEAYLKGNGDGLSVSPATVEVWAGDDRPVTVSGWSVHALAAGPGFAAAVAGSQSHEWMPSGPHKRNVEISGALRSNE
jgi:4'-phosphopantetheinyl transferase